MDNRIALSFLNLKSWDFPFTLKFPVPSATNNNEIFVFSRQPEMKGGFFLASKRIEVICRALRYIQRLFIEPDGNYRWPACIATDPRSPFALKAELFIEGMNVLYEFIINEEIRSESITVKTSGGGYSAVERDCHLNDSRALVDSIVKSQLNNDANRQEELAIGALYLKLCFLEFMASPGLSSYIRGPLSVCLDPELAQEDGYLIVRDVAFFLNRGNR